MWREEELPAELRFLCFSFLSPRDLWSASLVCKRWMVAAQDEYLWQSLFEESFGGAKRRGQTFRARFVELSKQLAQFDDEGRKIIFAASGGHLPLLRKLWHPSFTQRNYTKMEKQVIKHVLREDRVEVLQQLCAWGFDPINDHVLPNPFNSRVSTSPWTLFLAVQCRAFRCFHFMFELYRPLLHDVDARVLYGPLLSSCWTEAVSLGLFPIVRTLVTTAPHLLSASLAQSLLSSYTYSNYPTSIAIGNDDMETALLLLMNVESEREICGALGYAIDAVSPLRWSFEELLKAAEKNDFTYVKERCLADYKEYILLQIAMKREEIEKQLKQFGANVLVEEPIGSGYFSTVWKGTYLPLHIRDDGSDEQRYVNILKEKEKEKEEDETEAIFNKRNEERGEPVAIKIAHNEMDKTLKLESIVLSHLTTHPNVVQYKGCTLLRQKDLKDLEEQPLHENEKEYDDYGIATPLHQLNKEYRFSLLFEYAEKGSLLNYLFGGGPSKKPIRVLTHEQRCKIASGVCAAMVHLHSNSIRHNDIYSGNILLTDSFEPKLCDFGLADTLPSNSALYERLPKLPFSTPPKWRDPALIPSALEGLNIPHRTSQDILKSDIYSFGMLLTEVFGASCLCRGQTWSVTGSASYVALFSLPEAAEDQLQELKGNIPSSWLQLIQDCLNNNVTERPSASILLQRIDAQIQIDMED